MSNCWGYLGVLCSDSLFLRALASQGREQVIEEKHLPELAWSGPCHPAPTSPAFASLTLMCVFHGSSLAAAAQGV